MIVNKERFDNQIKKLKEDVLDLFLNVKKEHEATLLAIQNHDFEISNQIIKNDEEIRKIAESLTKIAIWRIASQQPVATDLRKIIGYMNIIRDLERISNYAKNISKFNVKYKPEEEWVKEISKLMKIAFEMIDLIVEAIDKEDYDLVYEAAKKDTEIDKAYKSAIKQIINKFIQINQNKSLLTRYTAEVQQLKYIERLGDHLVNICETILFISEGKFYVLSATLESED